MALRHALFRRAIALLALGALLGGVAGAAPAARAQDARLVWSAIPGMPREVWLEDVFMLSPEQAWAVGRSRDSSAGYAYSLHLVDGRWQIAREGVFRAALYGVAALDSQTIWAVGDYGLIVRRDSAGWAEVPAPSDQITLRTVQMLGDGSGGWAAGDEVIDNTRRLVMLRYADGRWQRAEIETPESYSTISSLHISGGGGWAVGSHIWRLRGNDWRLEGAPNPCGEGYSCSGSYSGVRAFSADAAIAVGARRSICPACTTQPYIARRDESGWHDLFPSGLSDLIPPAPQYPENAYMGAVFFTDQANGVAVGTRNYPGGAEIFALHYSDNTWHYAQVLAQNGETPEGLFMADPTRGLLVGNNGVLVSYGYGPQTTPPSPGHRPTEPVDDPGMPGVRYFPETGHTLRGSFLDYWERSGGLTRFGYPRTEAFAELSSEDGRAYTVQYFERARFEYHPEHAGTPYEVLLGLLGHWVTADRKGEAPFQAVAPSGQPGAVYFPETGHSMASEFVGYWQRNGGLPIYGYPISEPFYETNAADRRSYLVQYFERNRFEYHPDLAGTPYEVLLGLLGNEYLSAQGW